MGKKRRKLEPSPDDPDSNLADSPDAPIDSDSSALAIAATSANMLLGAKDAVLLRMMEQPVLHRRDV